ncbi:MAG TPA: DUF2185 domain-containing protein [Caulobacteraceae bacterium]|jgi:hypothetical protein
MNLTKREGVLALIAAGFAAVCGALVQSPALAREKCAAKTFRLNADDFKDVASGRGGCVATDRITVDGAPIGYMYREAPQNEADSGWAFFSGDEDEKYLNDQCHFAVYDINTIANYDPVIIGYLDGPIGFEYTRDGDTFKKSKMNSH